MFSRMFLLRRDDQLVRMVNSVGVDLPTPANISFYWNFGSLLGLLLFSQMITGFLLSVKYVAEMNSAFGAMDSMNRDIWGGWLTRYAHISGSSAFFLFLYFHIGRGMYFSSFQLSKVWLSGVTIFLLSMASAFLGYVLPWGQMSYWGATVITKFFSVVPYIGSNLVVWIWGSFSVDYPTLSRFFSLHFLLPLVLLALVGVHMMFLHESGSKNPLGVKTKADKVIFYPYFLSKDILGFFIVPGVFITLFFGFPWNFMEYQNFMPAKSLVTPPHMQPEWYFLAAYAVLRAIPNKLGGVLALVMFVVILYFLPFISHYAYSGRGSSFLDQMLFWGWVVNFILLTWMGACPVEEPYIFLSRMGCVLYFLFYLNFRGSYLSFSPHHS